VLSVLLRRLVVVLPFSVLLQNGESRDGKLICSRFLLREFCGLEIFFVLLLPSLQSDGCKSHT